MQDVYVALIDQIIAATLKGEIRSKEQVYQLLQNGIQPGAGELFERCLQARAEIVQAALASTDDLKQAKAMRQQRALKLIQDEWRRWQMRNQVQSRLMMVVDILVAADPEDRLGVLLQAMDPNQPQRFSQEQLQQLAPLLEQRAGAVAAAADLASLAAGLRQGFQTWQRLEPELVSWIYDQSRDNLGFGNPAEQRGPWSTWAKSVTATPLSALFSDLAQYQTVTTAAIADTLTIEQWLELAVVLQRLQLGLVAWFDQQPYSPTAGKRLSIATFLSFTILWSQLSEHFQQRQQPLFAQAGFQMALQSLRQFAQQSYFPLYGGLFTALSGEPLQAMLDYLDQPLRQVANTAAKARMLTLLGYSQRALGRYDQALRFHQQALEIAREAKDQACEIANLNHLSRTQVMQKDYGAAIDTSQRALILARQSGDRLGEANALANYGYSEVLQAQAQLDDRYELILGYLQRGLQLSEQLGDLPSQALCANSLGVVQVALGNPQAAVDSLRKGLYVAQNIGDQLLQGLNYAYLAEAYRQLESWEKTIATGCLGMYLLHQINSPQWRQPAGVLTIVYGQLGAEAFQAMLSQFRSQLLPQIGVDGYDYLPKLLAQYRESLS